MNDDGNFRIGWNVGNFRIGWNVGNVSKVEIDRQTSKYQVLIVSKIGNLPQGFGWAEGPPKPLRSN